MLTLATTKPDNQGHLLLSEQGTAIGDGPVCDTEFCDGVFLLHFIHSNPVKN